MIFKNWDLHSVFDKNNLMIKIASLKPMKVTVTTSGCQCKQSYILLIIYCQM